MHYTHIYRMKVIIKNSLLREVLYRVCSESKAIPHWMLGGVGEGNVTRGKGKVYQLSIAV